MTLRLGAALVAAGFVAAPARGADTREDALRFIGAEPAGKVYMTREALFGDVDAVLHWHPGDRNAANLSTSLANKSAKFRFTGVSAHDYRN